jgi:hypothetical protein
MVIDRRREMLVEPEMAYLRLFSDELETATEDGSECLTPRSSVPRSGSTIRFLLLDQRKRAHAIPHRALITYGRRRT